MPQSDTCDASRFQSLVGGPLDDPAALALAAPRVRFSTEGEPGPPDRRPERLNIVRTSSGIVTRVYCG